ncbi:type II toxin-antitoxin system Rv0910 family toxin [Nocardia mexicana]|uniref:Polyketide cyclase/dehydrase/lipid transport protein n=1 Tax=Nocardia mexicana TaxID=279262 RepID=A0A370GG54_9NOCA|nr:SRPBCC family protein [Nocardia mexicana]RDI42795.1 polyketide cyclase/dehydrase/lipid transport protein [Nocardia mexicana]
MNRIEVVQELAVAPPQLYSIISDTDSWGDWFTLHDRFLEQPPEQLQLNSRLVQAIRVMGMSHTVELTVTEFRPPIRLTLSGRGTGGMTCDFEFGIERSPAGTTLSISGVFEGPMLNAQLSRIVEEDGRTQLTASLDRLSTLAAARTPGPGR